MPRCSGLAVLLRLQNSLICVALVGRGSSGGGGERRPRSSASSLVWALLLGLLDRLTWGGWFHSAVAYWRYNWVQGKGRALRRLAAGLLPPGPLDLDAGGGGGVLVPAVVLGVRRAPALAATVALFLAVHSAIPHKELRFILPVLPAAMALAGVGLAVAATPDGSPDPGRGWRSLAALLSGARFHTLTFGDLGAYDGQRDAVSAYEDFAPVNRLLLVASELPGLCGLKVEATHIAWAGGYTYFHRDAPMYSHLGPPRESRHYNVVLTPAFAVPPARWWRATVRWCWRGCSTGRACPIRRTAPTCPERAGCGDASRARELRARPGTSRRS